MAQSLLKTMILQCRLVCSSAKNNKGSHKTAIKLLFFKIIFPPFNIKLLIHSLTISESPNGAVRDSDILSVMTELISMCELRLRLLNHKVFNAITLRKGDHQQDYQVHEQELLQLQLIVQSSTALKS